jgi:selenocysteine lyase/cysteine desulfurase
MDDSIRSQFSPAPGIAYLDSATYGLAPEPTVRAMRAALDSWQAGTAEWITDWDRPAEAARSSFASLIGTAAELVSLQPAASVGVGLVAEGLGPGDEIVVPADEFTSVLFPLLVARERGAVVREVTIDRLADEIGPRTTFVATSLVQMQTGRMADLAAVLDRTEAVGARVLVDATQGIPFVRLAPLIDRIDYVVAAAYKHLLCPRGTAFLAVRRDRLDALPALNANWRSADDPYGRYFGGPLTLAPDARRLDVSLAWIPWIGAVESLRLLESWAPTGAFEAALDLALELADRLGVAWGGASLVCVPIADADAARTSLAAAGVRASVRGTAIRCATHVYTTRDDIERAARAIEPFLADGRRAPV